MSKRYREAIEVEDPEGTPDAFTWRDHRYTVLAVLGHWREDAGYWAGGQLEVPQRDLWRVEAQNATPGKGVYELVAEGDRWRLDRVWD